MALDIQAADFCRTSRKGFRIHAADLVVAVIEQLQDPLIAQDNVGHVRSHQHVRGREPARGQHGDHGRHVADHLLSGRLGRCPVSGRGIDCRIACAVEVAHLPFLEVLEVVHVLVHGAGVCKDYLRRHGFLTSCVHAAQFVQIGQHNDALSLLRGKGRVESLPKTALSQVVNSEGALRCDIGRSKASHGVAVAQDRDPTFSGSYERGRLFVSLLVLHQHVIGGENVGRRIGREIPIQKERVQRRELLDGSQQCVSIIKIKSHLSVLLLKFLPRQRSGSPRRAVLPCLLR